MNKYYYIALALIFFVTITIIGIIEYYFFKESLLYAIGANLFLILFFYFSYKSNQVEKSKLNQGGKNK